MADGDEYDAEAVVDAHKALLDQHAPFIHSAAQFSDQVTHDEENLVMLALMSSQSGHCVAIEKGLASLLSSKAASKHLKCYRIDVHNTEGAMQAAVQTLKITAVPTLVWRLRNVEFARHTGASNEKIEALTRNCLLRRNEEMREHDLAKEAVASPEEDAEGDEEQEES